MREGLVGSEVEQFVSRGRYTVIPRTLVFLTHGEAVLLLRGAPTKRLWANRYNGLGGHVEPGETIAAAALREVWEEAGIGGEKIDGFRLRALINVEGEGVPAGGPGVLLCVFTGVARTRTVVGSAEGMPEWIPVSRLGEIDLVNDDRLLPRLLDGDELLFGHLRQEADGRVTHFTLE